MIRDTLKISRRMKTGHDPRGAALGSSAQLDDPLVAPGDCVAAIVMLEPMGAGEAEAWLHTFLRAHELRQDLPPPLSAACKGKRRF